MSQTSEKKVTKSHKLMKKVIKSYKLFTEKVKLVKNNYITEQKLVNLNNQMSKVITKNKYLDQDAGDGLRLNH